MGVAPEDFADCIMAAPRRIGDQEGGIFWVRLQRIDRGDEIPIHNLGHAADERILIKSLHEADLAVESFLIDVFFGVPNRFVVFFGDFQHVRGVGAVAMV